MTMRLEARDVGAITSRRRSENAYKNTSNHIAQQE